MAVLGARTIEIINNISPGADQVGLGTLLEQALSGEMPAGSISAAEIALADAKVLIGQSGGAAAEYAFSGDVSLTNGGVTAVVSLDLETATVTNIADTEVLIGTGSGTANFAALSGDVTLANDGTATVAALDLETATVTNIADTEVLIGTGAGTANFAALSGDVTLANDGTATVAALDLETATVTNIADTEVLIGTGAGTANFAALSGDVTLANDGTATVAALDLETATVTNIADTEVLIGTGAGTANFAALSGDVTLANDGTATVAALDLETATVTNIADTEVMIGTGAGTANFAALSGDVTMTNAGAVTIANDAVNEAKTADSSSAGGLYVKKHAVALYDFSVDGGAQGAITLASTATIPDNAVVVLSSYDVLSTCTSGTDAATIKVDLPTDGDLSTAIAISNGGNPWDAGVFSALEGNGAFATAPTTQKTTGARAVQITVAGGENLTAGKIAFHLEYYVTE